MQLYFHPTRRIGPSQLVNFKTVANLLLGYFWLVDWKKILLKLKASLASAEVLAGAVAKADQ
jgi:hypothetical protein